MKITLFLLVLVMVSVIPFAFAQESPISVQTDKSSYSEGEKIRITGELRGEPYQNKSIQIIIKTADNNLISINDISVNPNNTFNLEISAGGNLWKLDGIYTVDVYHGLVNTSTTFTYTGEKSVSPILPQKAISVQTDDNNYDEGDTILVTGEVSQLLGGYALSIRMIAPNGNIVSIDRLTVGADKKFSTNMAAGGSLMKVEGTYTITVQYGDNKSGVAETSFQFIRDNYPVEENSVSVITVTSNSFSYSNGDSIVISGNIEPYDSSSGEELTYLMISPINDVVDHGHIILNSDGTFVKTIVADGSLWKLAGDYMVEFYYGADSGKIAISYIGGETFAEPIIEPRPYEPITEPRPAYEPEPTTKPIPEWVRGVVLYWADGKISDSEFVAAIKFLIETHVMVL